MFLGGLLVVVSGPSGTGKGTLINLLKERNPNVRFSISATTRNPREGEVEGQNYFYKSVDGFKAMIDKDELIEWVEYCGNYYGTPKRYVESLTDEGYDVVLEIDVVGALNIKRKFPESVLIFIMPPSYDELRKRIEGRGTESREIIEKRLDRAKSEMKFVGKYDYVIMNDDVEKAVQGMNSILTAEKLRYKRNKDIIKRVGI